LFRMLWHLVVFYTSIWILLLIFLFLWKWHWIFDHDFIHPIDTFLCCNNHVIFSYILFMCCSIVNFTILIMSLHEH
jgi:hypothetical protein